MKLSTGKLLVVCLGLFGMTGTASGATVLYETGFEPPTFSLGALAGQAGWSNSGAAVVQGSVVKSGAQAVSVSANAPLFSVVNRAVPYETAFNPETVVRVTIDVRLSATSATTWTAIGLSGAQGFVSQLNIGHGFATLGLASTTAGSVAVEPNVWSSFEVEIDHRTQTVTAWVNGKFIGSGEVAGAPNVVEAVWFGLSNGESSPTDVAFFDNLVVRSELRGAAPLTFTKLAGSDGGTGFRDEAESAARFHTPTAVAVDAHGNLYVADSRNHSIRKVSPAGMVSTLAGSGLKGTADGTRGAARFDTPSGVAVDTSGNVYVADMFGQTIRKITPSGTVSTLAGAAGQQGSVDGKGSAARFYDPSGVAVDAAGTVYVAEFRVGVIRKITPDGVVTTIAGAAGQFGSVDGTGSAARFYSPRHLTVDGAGNVFVSDTGNHTIRKITPAGLVTTIAGLAGQHGSADGTGSAARFLYPEGLTSDGSGTLHVSEGANTIRRITPDGVVSTIAGTFNQSGAADGTGADARFFGPGGLAGDAAGTLYVADSGNHTIRRITTARIVSTLAGLARVSGSANGPGAEARFHSPQGIDVDAQGNVYVGDSTNKLVRKITPSGEVSTLAGVAGQPGTTDGPPGVARFRSPIGVAVDGSGNVYVSDDSAIRRITPAGVVSTLAGRVEEPGTDDGVGTAARFTRPSGMAVDGDGNVYVADYHASTIRKVTAAGVVTTIAGKPNEYGATDGPAAEARFSLPSDVAIDPSGNLYIVESLNNTIRKLTPEGIVSTLAGKALEPGRVDGSGIDARFDFPGGLAIDGDGNLYVAERELIRKVTPAGVVSTIGGLTGMRGSQEGTGSAARFEEANGVAVDRMANVYVSDTGHGSIRIGTPSLPDAAAIDDGNASPGLTRLLFPEPDTASSWQWTIIRRPADSTASLSSTTSRSPTFTPDKPGVYAFQLIATRDGVQSITTVDLNAEPPRRRSVRK